MYAKKTRHRVVLVIVVLVTVGVGGRALLGFLGVPDLSGCERITFDGKRPPLPDFRKPVDYVSWANRYLAEDRDVNTTGIYDGFWGYGSDNHTGMPEPSQNVQSALSRMAFGAVYEANENPEVDAYVKRAAPYLEIFKRATESKQYCFQVRAGSEMPVSVGTLPSPDSGVNAVLVLLGSAWKDSEPSVSQLQDMWKIGLNHARHLGQSKVLVVITAANRVRMMIYRSIQTAVYRKAITGDRLVETLRLVTDIAPRQFDLEPAIYLEWGERLALLQDLYPEGRLNRRFASEIMGFDEDGSTHSLNMPAMKKGETSLGGFVAELDRYFVKLLDISHAGVTVSSIRKIEDLQNALDISPVAVHPLRPFLYNPIKVFRFELRGETMRRAVALTLMLHDFKQRHGKWPKRLSDIEMPEGCNCLIDPFSEREFIYRQSGESFLLYSVGEDQTDNNGKHGDWSPWRSQAEGTDFVFWPLQELGEW